MDTAAQASAEGAATSSAGAGSDFGVRVRRSAEYILVPLFALAVSAVLFSAFLMLVGKSPSDFYQLVWRGGFGTAFSVQNTLQRAAPVILTAEDFERGPMSVSTLVANIRRDGVAA